MGGAEPQEEPAEGRGRHKKGGGACCKNQCCTKKIDPNAHNSELFTFLIKLIPCKPSLCLILRPACKTSPRRFNKERLSKLIKKKSTSKLKKT